MIGRTIAVLGALLWTPHATRAQAPDTAAGRADIVRAAIGPSFVDYTDMSGIGPAVATLRRPAIDGGRLDMLAVGAAALAFLRAAKKFDAPGMSGAGAFYRVSWTLDGTTDAGVPVAAGGVLTWPVEAIRGRDLAAETVPDLLSLATVSAPPLGAVVVRKACAAGLVVGTCSTVPSE